MLEWSEFARRLGRELAGLERDTILIVRERDESRHYVQAMREPDRLYAEAVSNNFLDGPLLLTLADEEVMSEAGWQPPADPAPRNWWTELAAFAAAADYGRLSEVMVTALRDVQGVRRPSDLVYESFHRHGTGLVELLDFGIDIADPDRITRSRTTPAVDLPVGDMLPAAPAEAATPPAAVPEPMLGAPVPGPADDLESRLAGAKQQADHTTYFDLLVTAELVIPSPADPAAALPTITIGSGVYITVFTSPQALARVQAGPHHATSFAALLVAWPDPTWQLAVNPGLPSEVHLDATTVARLDTQQRAAVNGHATLESPNGRHNAPDEPPAAEQRWAPSEQPPTDLPRPPADPDRPLENSALPPADAGQPPADQGQPAAGAGQPLADQGQPVVGADQPLADQEQTTPAGYPTYPAPQQEPLPVQEQPPAAWGEPPPAAGEQEPPRPSQAAPNGRHSSPDGFPGTTSDRPVEAPLPPVEAPVGLPEAVPAMPMAAPVGLDGARPDHGPALEIRAPHGTRLWHWSGEDDEELLVAVYDAIGGAWARVRADAVPAPRTE